MMPVGYNSDLQIVQGAGYVAIVQEMIHDTRVIPTDGRKISSSNIPQWMGESSGHWEGDTLVVESKNFTTRTADPRRPDQRRAKGDRTLLAPRRGHRALSVHGRRS